MARIYKSAPWITYYQEMEVLFEGDLDINVVLDEDEFELRLYVKNTQKADILEKYLPVEVVFGNNKLPIQIIPSNNSPICEMEGNDWEILFRGNTALDYVREIDDFGFQATYVVFKSKVVQYYSDNISDINGLTSTLYQDIAKRIFNDKPGVFFCTDV